MGMSRGTVVVVQIEIVRNGSLAFITQNGALYNRLKLVYVHGHFVIKYD